MVDQIAMLVDYVKQEFPGRSVWDRRDHDRSAHTVSVATDAGILLLTASFEFLSDNTPIAVSQLLKKWKVADALRETGSTGRKLVTRIGWQVTSR
jgi:hypothetical protein